MPSRNRNRKRKRPSPPIVEHVIYNSDTEVSFKLKRPRTGSFGSDPTKGSSNSSSDSGFKSNSSASANACGPSDNIENLYNSSSIKEVAVYYAKKSPAKQPPSESRQISLNSCTLSPLGSSSIEIQAHADDDDELSSQKPYHEDANLTGRATFGVLRKKFKSSSDVINLMQKKRRNIKGLTLDVEASAKRRKVENIIELRDNVNAVLPRRSPNGYLLPDPIPVGIILTDLMRKRWKIGKSIGVGGFGEIYSAELLTDGWSNHGTKCEPNYVVKVVSLNAYGILAKNIVFPEVKISNITLNYWYMF